MAAHVYLTGSDTSSGILVLSGRVVSGEVGAGMHLVVSLNSALDVVVAIDEVERGDGSEVRLVFRDAETAEILVALDVCNEEVEIGTPG